MSNNIIFTFAGFEERFYFGTLRLIGEFSPKEIIIMHSSNPDESTENSINKILTTCKADSITCTRLSLPLQELQTCHREFYDHLTSHHKVTDSCILDITTMPRELIFIILKILENKFGVVHYVYNNPGFYDEGWLTRKYDDPKTIFGYSGEPLLTEQKSLLVITGFDSSVTEIVINSIEPNIAHLGLQTSDKFDNQKRNVLAHTELFKSHDNISFFEVDAFSTDHGQNQIENTISKLPEDSNIIISTLGPKLSAIALYQLFKKLPKVSINYVPAQRVNKSYSSGIGKPYYGKIVSQANSVIEYKWLEQADFSDDIINGCAELFSSHYGIWGKKGPNPGSRVAMSAKFLKEYLTVGSCGCLAYYRDELVGYALAIRDDIPGKGIVTWISQLVVHTEYRNQRIGTQILNSLWGFSDHYAWGLATSSPFAIKALEKATRRRCTPAIITKKLTDIQPIFNNLFYLADKEVSTDDEHSVVNSLFHVDHKFIDTEFERIISDDYKWTMGPLEDGFEWLAVTFKEQEQLPLSESEIKYIFSASDDTVQKAYRGMTMDSDHGWMKHTPHEVDFVINTFQLSPPANILDFGAGSCRHGLELAKRGYNVTCVDFIPGLIEFGQAEADKEGLTNIDFIVADCRKVNLQRKFDYAICLYDVVGSFADDFDNNYLVYTLSEHLNPEGKVLFSVMNLELSATMAINVGSVYKNPDLLLNLPPNNIMEQTGNVFDPNYYHFDNETLVFYRKEQFTSNTDVPRELIVRDKRYTKESFSKICTDNHITPKLTKCVKLGQWTEELDCQDKSAKELLCYGIKE